MSVWSIISIVMCVIEVGLIIFMAINLLEVLDITYDFKRRFFDWLKDLERKLKEYNKK